MEILNQHRGKVLPLVRDNIDTDMIIPAEFLTSVDRGGYGKNVFKRLREQEPNFPFNQEEYRDASVLLVGKNFGCGSSREHAVWALKEWGLRVIIGESFADIFFSNSGKNGLLLVSLSKEVVTSLQKEAESSEGLELSLSVERQCVMNGEVEHSFSLDPYRKHCLLHGLDDLDYLLNERERIQEHFGNKSC